jgi:hypothetical protein
MSENPFIKSTLRQFRFYKSLADKTIERLDTARLHFSPSSESNSIAVLIGHLHGNMLSRWTDFLNSDGEKEWRKRDEEFEPHDESKAQLIEKWEAGWNCLFNALEPLQTEDLSRTVYIRKEAMSAMEAIHRQIAHYAYHVGQIVYLGKVQLDAKWESLSIPKKKV